MEKTDISIQMPLFDLEVIRAVKEKEHLCLSKYAQDI